ncbi:MAG: hypothetical protein P4M08_15285 [Oligoflexia bacterium]|nr:hypothetical protein [Oligoflexia bacterium]
MLKKLSLIGLMTFALTSAGTALADDAATNAEHQAHHATETKTKEPSSETRKQMAEAHQKMADCLKSTKPFSECEEELMKSCPAMKHGHCPMMEGKGGHKGHHMDDMTGDHGKKDAESKPSEDHSAHQPEKE